MLGEGIWQVLAVLAASHSGWVSWNMVRRETIDVALYLFIQSLGWYSIERSQIGIDDHALPAQEGDTAGDAVDCYGSGYVVHCHWDHNRDGLRPAYLIRMLVSNPSKRATFPALPQ